MIPVDASDFRHSFLNSLQTPYFIGLRNEDILKQGALKGTTAPITPESGLNRGSRRGRMWGRMKSLFAMSMVCALMSLLAVISLSAMSIVPRHGVENEQMLMMLAAGIFGVTWLCFAVWIRVRQSPPTQWLRRLLFCVSIVYSLGILLFVIG